ncbi:hypothetical protein Q3H58_002452 [Pseudomonas psychrotolerans]|nr:hypothetical protein [Pseudomonas psychrotolerans]
MQTGLGLGFAGLAEQPHRGQAHGGIGIAQLQVGQGGGQGIFHLLIGLGVQALLQEGALLGLGLLAQGQGGGQALGGVAGQQLTAGLGGADEDAQAIVQAHRLGRAGGDGGFALGGGIAVAGLVEGPLGVVDVEAAVLQGLEHRQLRRLGRGGPVLQEFGLVAGAGSGEVGGRAGLDAGGEQQQQGQKEKA